ncbi:MAG: hypothetical protein ACPL7K_02915 [Armatimonadota bacterium]
MRLLLDPRAYELTEVALMLALVAVVAMVALRILGVNIRDLIQNVANALR